ncbi:MAG: divergent polysaccharide deacetylase family protein [Desulfamplus sp.]
MDSNEPKKQQEPATESYEPESSETSVNQSGSRGSFLYNFIHEMTKTIAAICILISILATAAMIADLYFNNTFSHISNFLFGKSQISENKSVNRIEPASSVNKSLSSDKSAYSQDTVFEVFDDNPDSKRAEKQNLNKEEEPQQNEQINQNEQVKKNEQTEQKSEQPKHNERAIDKNKEEIFEKTGGTPKIAIIIDDIGFDPKIADAISKIDKNFTISILPGSPSGRQIAKKLHSKGMEIILHQPMEPLEYPSVDPGYGAILSNMKPADIVKILNRNLDALPQVSGVNNHMGSKLTQLNQPMEKIFEVLKKRELFFIDSLTSNDSTARQSAERIQILFASRDIFLDNIKDKKYIKKQLMLLVKIAKQRGRAIAIGHPYNETFTVLKEEIPAIRKSVKIVPVSQLVGYL